MGRLEAGASRHGLRAAPGTLPPVAPGRGPAPGDNSAGAGHARDSGGGSAPLIGIIPSRWWPGLAAASTVLPFDASTSGRVVRYCGPPS
ncbi:hypothetical protein [Paractinoplanes maris]|uniref:hypothetical protein n=1 Tax=Paractinoplanes maris TaxID=1734446 RepID=UPI0020204E8D|nr:hypothetical protein [Actinoplanes maris]